MLDHNTNILQLLDRPIAFHRCLVDLTQNVAGALLLSQAIYWQKRCESEDGWWWKTAEQWKEETGLHRKEFESARRSCSEFLAWERRGAPAKCYYMVRVLDVHSRLSETCKLVCTKRANKNGRNGQSLSTETTSETTSERGSGDMPPYKRIELGKSLQRGLKELEELRRGAPYPSGSKELAELRRLRSVTSKLKEQLGLEV